MITMAINKSFLIFLLVGFVHSEKLINPTCFHQHNRASCCLNVDIKGHDYNTCVELAFKPEEMKAVASLNFNDHSIVSKDTEVGQFCAPLPAPLTMLKGCLDVYYADLNVREKSVDVCFVVEVPKVLQIKFDCFRMVDGKFEHHSEHEPKDSGLFELGWANGKPTFEVNVPKGIGKGRS